MSVGMVGGPDSPVDRPRLFCDLVATFSGRPAAKCLSVAPDSRHRDGRIPRFYGGQAVRSAFAVVHDIDRRRAEGGDGERDPAMMAYFTDQAGEEKRNAASKDEEWIRGASEVSKEWREGALRKTVCQLAQDHYDYSHHRASLRQGPYVIDPAARELWLKVAGHLPTEHVIKDQYGRY